MSPLLFLVGALALCYIVKSVYRRLLLGMSLTGPWAVPLLGNAQMVGKMRPECIFLIFTELRERYGATYRLWLGPQLWVFLHSTEETRDALNDGTLLKADAFNQLDVLIGNGLLISHGKYWQTQRRILGPAFQLSVLRGFAMTIAAHADLLVQKLAGAQGVGVEVTEYIFPCLFDAIVETSMGKRLDTQAEMHSCYTHAFHKISELLFKRMINPLLSPDFIFKRTKLWRELKENLNIVHTLMEAVITDRMNNLQEENDQSAPDDRRQRTMLDALIHAKLDGEPLSFRQIRDEVITFVFAGVDTTAAALAFALYALAKYPKVQARLSAEIERIPHNAGAEVYNMDAVNTLEYLDMFLKECLRFYTIVPTTGRQTTCDTKIGKRVYCAGITIWLNLYGLAHDANYFPRPYEFWPERFAKDKPQPLPFSYLPFSGGPHVCIGRKYSLLLLKVLIIKIVQRYELRLLHPNAPELVLQAQMVLKAMGGIHLRFLSR